jgi:hypothetical protein
MITPLESMLGQRRSGEYRGTHGAYAGPPATNAQMPQPAGGIVEQLLAAVQVNTAAVTRMADALEGMTAILAADLAADMAENTQGAEGREQAAETPGQQGDEPRYL